MLNPAKLPSKQSLKRAVDKDYLMETLTDETLEPHIYLIILLIIVILVSIIIALLGV